MKAEIARQSIREIDSYTAPLTRELALEFSTMPCTKGERPIRKDRVEELRGHIECGSFHSPDWASGYLNGVRYRVNGQHSSLALIESNGSFPTGLKANIKDFVVDTEEDLGVLFTYFDNQNGARTSRDVLRALLAGSSEYPDAVTEKVGSAMHFAQCSFETKATAVLRNAMLRMHPTFIDFAYEFVGHRQMGKVAVIAAMYKTWKKSPVGADEFWHLVRSEAHPSPNNATRVLLRVLRDVPKSNTRHSRDKEVYAKSINAWNNWRRGIEITRLLHLPTQRGSNAKADLPEAI